MAIRSLILVVTIQVLAIIEAYTIPKGIPLPVLRNGPLIYRGQVFIIQEMTNASEPFIGQIVEGGIEMIPPYPKPFVKSPLNAPQLSPLSPLMNDARPETQDDQEYFAVLVTPETVSQAQISRTTTITIPLHVLLVGVSSRIPWVMVLRRENHFNYFKSFFPVPIPIPSRRRSKASDMTNELNTKLVTGSQKYDLVFAENEKNEFHNICASIIDELVYLSSLLHRFNNNDQEGLYVDDQLDFDNAKNNETATNTSTTQKVKTTTDSILSLKDFIEKFSSANNANRKVVAN